MPTIASHSQFAIPLEIEAWFNGIPIRMPYGESNGHEIVDVT